MVQSITLVHSASLSISFRLRHVSRNRATITTRSELNQLQLSSSSNSTSRSSVIADSLRLLEWDKLCDAVSSFASTSPGRKASLATLSSAALAATFHVSTTLLAETAAAVRLIDHGAPMDFAALELTLVESAIDNASRGLPISGMEAISVAGLLRFAQTLQVTLEMAAKEDTDCYNSFMPLAQMIMDAVVSRQLIKSIQQVIDDDGSVKDTASSELRRYREKARALERKDFRELP